MNTPEEQMANVIKYHARLRTEYEISCKLVEEFFISKVKQACHDKDIGLVKELIRKCPDHVTKVFAVDMMRFVWPGEML